MEELFEVIVIFTKADLEGRIDYEIIAKELPDLVNDCKKQD